MFDELGFYLLAGAAESPAELVDELRTAEDLGLGAAFLSERWNVKEAATICGAAAVASRRIAITTAATNYNIRHPLVTASFAATMHALSSGRFTLGIGRGPKALFDKFGLPCATTAQMEDFALLMRRLWKGEVVVGHDGPAGTYPALALDPRMSFDIPLGLVAFGPQSLSLAGRAFDTVVLHTFFTDETTARCVQTVRDAAERAGRDPQSVKVWSCFATVGDHIPEEVRIRKTVGRLATYLQGYGPLMVRTNNWDRDALQRFYDTPLVRDFPGLIDAAATIDQLQQVAELIPSDWLAPAATGSPDQCAAAVTAQFELGVDGVIMHGATPGELQPIVSAYAARGR